MNIATICSVIGKEIMHIVENIVENIKMPHMHTDISEHNTSKSFTHIIFCHKVIYRDLQNQPHSLFSFYKLKCVSLGSEVMHQHKAVQKCDV